MTNRSPERTPLGLRVCLFVIQVVSRLVPRSERRSWIREWEAELLHRWGWLESRRQLTWTNQLDLFRRVMGALPDAAWLRRQLTADAEVVHDARHGLRLLGRDPGFSASAVAILALGIGSSVAVFTVADTLLLRPLPYPRPDRLVTLWQTNPRQGGERDAVAPGNFMDWRERSRSFAEMAAAIPYSYEHTGGDEPEVLFAVQVTEGFFRAMGVEPLLGRAFLPEEHQEGRHRVVVLSHGVWQRRFGGDPGLIGRPLSLDGEPHTVVGILPPDFEPGLLPGAGERGLWTPYVLDERERPIRASAWWNVVARLKPRIGLAEARGEMQAITAGIARENPRTNTGVSALVVPFHDHLTGGVRPTLVLLVGAVVLLLLVTWANVAGLLLARGGERERELAIRASLGAGRARLARQLLAENGVLAVLGCLSGLILARWGIHGIVALSPVDVPRIGQVRLDGRAAAFAGMVTIITCLACGILPALRFSRPRLDGSLKDGPRGATAGRRRQRLRQGLVIAEVAAAVVLLSGAGLLARSLGQLLRVDPGFRGEGVVALQVFAWDRNPTPEKIAAFFRETLNRIQALPGVTAAGVVSRMPFIEASIGIRSPVVVEGLAERERGEEPTTYLSIATAGYFEAMRIPLLAGRGFQAAERYGPRVAAVVNEILARRCWPSENPIGRKLELRWQGKPLQAEVVGVVSAVHHDRLDRTPDPEVFLPHDLVPFGSMTYVVRTRTDPGVLTRSIKERVWSVDPMQPFYRTATVPELVSRSLAGRRFLVLLLAAFAGMALALSAIGLYGLISFVAAQRTREIGVRLALGAGAGHILRMVLGQGMALILCGLGVGLGVTLAFSRSLHGLLYGVSPTDAATMGTVAVVLSAVSLLACYLPARRAMRVDPVAALRAE